MIDFLIKAFCLFIIVKAVNKVDQALKKNKEDEPKKDETPADVKLLTEIRDLLKEKEAE